MHKEFHLCGSVTRLIRVALFALTLSSVAVLAPAEEKSDPTTTLYFNAHVFTAEINAPYAEAVAIRGDRILAVGTRYSVEKIAGKSARKVDLQGQFLMPGMIDAHVHPIYGGITLVMASYPDKNISIPDLVNFIRAQMNDKKSFIGDTVLIYQVDLGFWSHAAELDAILSHGEFAAVPIVLNGYDGHTGWANEAARVRAGVTADFIRHLPTEKQKFFGFDSNYASNGFVVYFGKGIIDQSLPAPTPELLLASGKAAIKYMNGAGITGWLDAAATGSASGDALTAGDEGILPIYRELAKEGLLTAHVAAYPVVSPDAGLGQITLAEKLRKQFSDVPNLTIPGIKIFADGVVEFPAQTAAMLAPYSNTGIKVAPMFKQTSMNALVKEADRRGMQVHVHALGDAAVRASLDAFELARAQNPGSKLKHAITHVQFVTPEDQARFAQYNVIAALQLFWADADPSTVEMLKPYVDPVAYKTMYAARGLLDNGAIIAGASDWPVSTAEPFMAMYVAETRKGEEGVLFAEQSMPRMAMMYAYTRNSADALNQLNTIGTLAPGKRADLVLVDKDVLTVSADELKDAKVLSTMFAGKIVFGSGL